MLSSIPWKQGVLVLAAASIGLTLAKGNLGGPDNSPAAGKDLLADSGIPAPVRSILQRACQDCHSDRTTWPWYAAVPPVSWQLQSDVTRARTFMNLSRWGEYSNYQRRGFMMAIQAATQARIMPPPKYVWMHRNARLSDEELKILRDWALGKTRVSSQNAGISR